MNENELIEEFCDNVDKELKMQQELNMFAAEILPLMTRNINTDEVVRGEYNNKKLCFKLSAQTKNNRRFYTIKVMDLEQYSRYFKMGVPQYCKAKRADFEHDPQYNIDDEIRNATVMLLFDIFGIQIKPSEEDDGMVRV